MDTPETYLDIAVTALFAFAFLQLFFIAPRVKNVGPDGRRIRGIFIGLGIIDIVIAATIILTRTLISFPLCP